MDVIYTVNDLIEDILEATKYDGKYVKIDYDSLLIKIYRRNGGRVSISTIMKKLRVLRRLKYIRMIQHKECKNGLCTSDKAMVLIYKPILERIILPRTWSLDQYIRYNKKIHRR